MSRWTGQGHGLADKSAGSNQAVVIVFSTACSLQPERALYRHLWGLLKKCTVPTAKYQKGQIATNGFICSSGPWLASCGTALSRAVLFLERHKCEVTQLQVSDAHIALQQVIHFLGGLFFKLALLAEAMGKYATVSGTLEQRAHCPLPGSLN